MTDIAILPARTDNYIYLAPCPQGGVLAVDPGASRPVREWLEARGQSLCGILITHHHGDHMAGVPELLQAWDVPVVAPRDDRIPCSTVRIGEEDPFACGGLHLRAVETPGHGSADCSYIIDEPPGGGPPVLFSGDALFVGGCGRLFEGTPQQMWHSLRKLAALPEDTLVYCGHEYTEENYAFAASILPGYAPLHHRREHLLKELREGRPTVPSTIGQEKETNIFLLADHPAVREALAMPDAPAADVFAELRRRKDRF